jgi:hypothetical protein
VCLQCIYVCMYICVCEYIVVAHNGKCLCIYVYMCAHFIRAHMYMYMRNHRHSFVHMHSDTDLCACMHIYMNEFLSYMYTVTQAGIESIHRLLKCKFGCTCVHAYIHAYIYAYIPLIHVYCHTGRHRIDTPSPQV